MKLKTPRKTLSKGALIAALFLSNMVVATERANLQRRDSFKKLEDLRAEKKEKDGEQVFYRRDGELRPYGLIDDITEPGQSTKGIKDREYSPVQPSQVLEYFKQLQPSQAREDFNQVQPSQVVPQQRKDNEQPSPKGQSKIPILDDKYDPSSISFESFMWIDDEKIKKIREVKLKQENIKNLPLDQFNKKLRLNPDITIVLDFGNAQFIDDRCLVNLSAMRKIRIHAPNVKSILSSFLEGCTGLTSVDLSSVTKVERIGDGFLSGCTSLTSLDLSSLTKVERIRDDFLKGCTSLTSLDFRSLTEVKNIGNNFLKECTSLTSLDLSSLTKVESIGYDFLTTCQGLKILKLPVFSNLKTIYANFLNGCDGLTTLDLSGFTPIKEIGNNFLAGCMGLATLDLGSFSNVELIGDGFLFNCPGLKTLNNINFSKVKVIGGDFLFECNSLTEIDLMSLPDDVFIRGNLLDNFRRLKPENIKIKDVHRYGLGPINPSQFIPQRR